MALLAEWNGHRFEVTPSAVRSFGNLQIDGACKTSDTSKRYKIKVPALDKAGNRQYDRKGNLKTKNVTHTNHFKKFSHGEAINISFAAYLHAQLGCDVRNEAMEFINDAEAGTAGYLYIDGHKIVSCQMMLTKASISDIKIASNGWWMSATVQLSMEQASTFDQGTDRAAAPVPARVARASANSAAASANSRKMISKVTTTQKSVNGQTASRAQLAAQGLDVTRSIIENARQTGLWRKRGA